MTQRLIILPSGRRGATGSTGPQGPAAPLTAADEVRLAAVEDYLERIEALENNTAVNLYIDANVGDDANDGLAATRPFKTLGAALEAPFHGRPVVLRIMSDLVHDVRTAMSYGVNIVMVGRGAGNAGSVQRKITFVNSTNSTGVGRLRLNGFNSFAVSEIDFEINTTAGTSTGVFEGNGVAHIQMNYGPGTISHPGTGAAALIHSGNEGGSARVTFGSTVVFTADVLGKLFAGVGSGGDPNADYRYNSNITSA